MNGSIHEAEEFVRRLPEVADCRIEVDPSGQVLAVRIVPRGAGAASELAQDVATLLVTETGLKVAPEQVQILAPAEAGAEPEAMVLEELEHEGRVRLVAVHTSCTEERTLVEVELALGTTSARGRAEARGAGSAPELMAQACLDALEKLCVARVALRLVGVRRTSVGSEEIVSVMVQEAAGRDERYHVGAARVGADLARATAYAVLASLNRRFGRILAGPAKHYRIS